MDKIQRGHLVRPAVFLDRDGVLVENINGDYIREESQIKILPHAKQAVAKLRRNGFEIVIVTNQACVNKGLITANQAWVLQKRIEDLLDPAEALDLKKELCPHMDIEGCACRKPEPGMILHAAKKYDINLSESYMIGDALSDVLAAEAAGVRPVFVLSGRGKESDLREAKGHIPVFDHVGTATDYICGENI